MMLLAFVAFFALVVLWMVAPTDRPQATPEGPLASSSSLSGADATA